MTRAVNWSVASEFLCGKRITQTQNAQASMERGSIAQSTELVNMSLGSVSKESSYSMFLFSSGEENFAYMHYK